MGHWGRFKVTPTKMMRKKRLTLSISGEGEGGSECWAIQGWWKHSDTVGRCLQISFRPDHRFSNLCLVTLLFDIMHSLCDLKNLIRDSVNL